MAKDDIVSGVFGITPEMYQSGQTQRDIAEQQAAQEAANASGGLFAKAYAPQIQQQSQLIGRALGGVLGIEDPQLQMVREVSNIRNQFDITTPEGMQSFAKAIAPKYPQLASQAIDRANTMMEAGAKAQTAQQKIDQEKKLRDELSKLPENASDEDMLKVFRKYGTPDQQARAIQASLDKKNAAALKNAGIAEASANKEAAKLDKATNTLSAVQGAAKLVGLNTTGMGSLLSAIPGTEARDLQAKFETIKANLASDMLEDMKSQSRTGASGLGALNKAELVMLQSARTSLDAGQSQKQIKDSLDVINKYYSKRAGVEPSDLWSKTPKKEETTSGGWSIVPPTPSSGIPK